MRVSGKAAELRLTWLFAVHTLQDRPLPKVPASRTALSVVAFLGYAAVMAWLMMRNSGDVFPSLLFITPAVIGYFYYHRRRCPECHSRLKVRHDAIVGTRRFRLFMDCPRCQIAWDTGEEIGDES